MMAGPPMTRIQTALFGAALAALASASHAAAEGEPLGVEEFQTKVEQTADPMGEAKAPAACAGFVAALRIAAPEGSDAKASFRSLEEELVFYTMMTHRHETGEDQETALAFTVPHVRDVSAVYLDWFRQNQKETGELLSSALRTNFGFCERMRDEMKAALESQ